MYSPPGNSGAVAKTALPVIGAICCGALLLFLLAATIVLALIPVYTPTKTATLSSTATRSNPITIYMNTGSTNSGRRKRQSSGLLNCVGGTFAPSANKMVESGLRKACQSSNKFSDVQVTSTQVSTESARRKRFSLVKRQSAKFVLIVTCFFYFVSTCGYQCQLNFGPVIAALVKANAASSMSLTNVQVLNSSGAQCAFLGFLSILGVLDMSSIGPGSASVAALAARPVVIISTATTTTTTSTTTTTTTVVARNALI
ncbi:unnamed protein product [Rotaria sp. Silwood1]|nr:unnamed protein product [Rotaria sp. Silwood1]CAF5024808.1 unnamed protein product [Rotaria sp. Silwood1]